MRGNVQVRFGEGDTPYPQGSTVPTLRRDFPKAPQGFCKHRLAYGIHKRAYLLATAKLEAGATQDTAPVPSRQRKGA